MHRIPSCASTVPSAAGRALRPTRFGPGCLVAALVSACSGGGGGPGEVPLTGTLIDSPVAGVRYETATRAGVTGAAGEFLYLAGETVRFFLGGTALGESPGQPEVTLFDLTGTPRIDGSFALRVTDEGAFLWRLMNTAVLLQTLDHDGDPSNGIEITPAVAALAEGVVIDLDLSENRFRRSRAFRGLLNALNAGALLADHRAVRSQAIAMQHLYRDEPVLFAAEVRSRDDDVDGLPDRIETHEHEPRGFVLRSTLVSDPNGTPSVSILEQDHGPNGEFLSFRQFDDSSGVPDFVSETTYDVDGERIVTETHDSMGQLQLRVEYVRNEFGDVLLKLGDGDGDGALDSIYSYAYDLRGNEVRRAWDQTADGVEDEVTTQAFDEADRRILREVDSDADGSADSVYRYEYDDAGRLTRRETDADADGLVDGVELFEYDADGNLTRSESDTDVDGLPDVVDTIVYDVNGNRVRSEHDSDGDGDLDRISLWEYDAAGYEIRYELDSDADGHPDTIHLTTRDVHGNAVLQELDTQADGVPDSVYTNSYTLVGWGSYSE